ncbi:MAG TPA: SAM-dependent methyltransferase, partial [Thermomicrobiales bacterium]|nr:SAM-dependent methyltransferase [Thermomicrobiales bacterium]
MPDITIVGLGPGDPNRRTVAAQRALESARMIFVRGHDGVDLNDLLTRDNVRDIGSLYVREVEPSRRWEAAIRIVCDAAADGPVVLAIPGHPRYGEGMVVGTLAEADRRGMTTLVIDGISVFDLIATGLGVDPLIQAAQLFNTRMVAAEMAS